jgi:Holliday junction resolvasome RuvABC endonuclease subunit
MRRNNILDKALKQQVPFLIKSGKITDQREFTIITNDPSMTAWGYSILTYSNEILFVDCIKTEKLAKKLRIRVGDDDCRRIHEIGCILRDVINKYNVNFIIGELPGGGSKSSSAAKSLGQAKSILQSAATFLNISIEWFSEGDAKKAVLRKQSATKQEMIDAIDKLYDVPWTGTKYKDEAIADSLAIYYVASQQSSILKMFRK